MLEDVSFSCPYCGETVATTVDCSGGSQDYTEDCPVCCNPVVLSVRVDWDGELLSIEAQAENR